MADADLSSSGGGPLGSGSHIVKPGDGIESLAFTHGFFWQTVWTDPNNAALKAARKDPNVLLPGDRVFIMEKRCKELSKPPEKTHRFRRKGVPQIFQVRFANWRDEPYAGLVADIDVDGKLTKGTADGDGILKIPISPDARVAKVRFENGHAYSIDLGHLDPVSEIVGVQQRLRNLGIYHAALSGLVDNATAAAIKTFQAIWQLEPSGQPDQPTRDLLVAANGS
jgi:hypothetical protein